MSDTVQWWNDVVTFQILTKSQIKFSNYEIIFQLWNYFEIIFQVWNCGNLLFKYGSLNMYSSMQVD